MSLRMLWKLDKEFARKVGRIQWEIYSKPRWITKWYHKVWWSVVPGVEIKVKWPVGWTEPIPSAGGGFIQTESSDPNDHYRPWMERNVGRQTWDWDWELRDNDINNNTLTIKFRRSKSQWATMAALKWS